MRAFRLSDILWRRAEKTRDGLVRWPRCFFLRGTVRVPW